ncbi:unnamed protein product [Owenia fusiformis]|uniref:Uncharacterized protein n=1 Tax=Owenia fusiformis TaxID=6347 RepID=A0A8J1Y379_OWEFU|nr:unnamed protein product [Owenia fusiformis]
MILPLMILVALSCISHCDAKCSKYVWAHIENTCIKSENVKIFTSSNVFDCMQACEDETTFTCRSIDYHSGAKECHLAIRHSGNWQLSSPCYLAGWQYAER